MATVSFVFQSKYIAFDMLYGIYEMLGFCAQPISLQVDNAIHSYVQQRKLSW